MGPTNPRRSVLLCDDLAPIRALLRDEINDQPGLQVVGEARDGEEAIRQAQQLQPDVILLDLAMPVLTGLEALPELRRVAPQARIVVYSGFARAVVGAEILAAGADAYVEKGANMNSILAELNSLELS